MLTRSSYARTCYRLRFHHGVFDDYAATAMDTRRTTCHRNCGSDWDLRLFKLESDRHCCGSFHQLFSYLRRAPVGTLITENAPTDETAVDAGATESLVRNSEKTGDWPSYNKSLTSERYSRLSEINTGNIQSLKVLCTYDTHQFTGFEFRPDHGGWCSHWNHGA